MDDAIVAGLVAIGAIAGAVILVSMLGPSIWDRGEQALESDVRSADVIATSMTIIDAESVGDRCIYAWVKNTGSKPIDGMTDGNVYLELADHGWGGSVAYFDSPGSVVPGSCGGMILSGTPSATATPVPTSTPTPTSTPLPTPTAAPTPEATSRPRIAFNSDRTGAWSVYLMDQDGSNPNRITEQMTSPDLYPTLSPDGTKVAFSSFRDGNYEIYAGTLADMTNAVRLTTDPSPDLYPSWSPDGLKILFSSRRHGNWEIFTVNSDGSGGLHRLTTDIDYDLDPSWSADGSMIVFSRFRSGNYDIFKMAADGSDVTRLTSDSGMDLKPSWSNDDKISFHSNRQGNWEIYVMDADGTGQSNLTNHSSDDMYPSWSPDGNKIAFQSTRATNVEVLVMDADGSNVTVVSNDPSNDAWPSWPVHSAAPGTPTPTPPGSTPASTPTPTPTPMPTATPMPGASPIECSSVPRPGDNVGCWNHAPVEVWKPGTTIRLSILLREPLANGNYQLEVATENGVSDIYTLRHVRPGSRPPTATPVPTATPRSGDINQRAMPHIFVGLATMSGQAAIDGAEVSVWVATRDFALVTAIVSQGRYVLKVPQYVTGPFDGTELVFKVNGQDTDQRYAWEEGGASVLDLSLD